MVQNMEDDVLDVHWNQENNSIVFEECYSNDSEVCSISYGIAEFSAIEDVNTLNERCLKLIQNVKWYPTTDEEALFCWNSPAYRGPHVLLSSKNGFIILNNVGEYSELYIVEVYRVGDFYMCQSLMDSSVEYCFLLDCEEAVFNILYEIMKVCDKVEGRGEKHED